MARKTPNPKQKSRQETLAELRLNPIFRAATALQALGGNGDIDSDIEAENLATLTLKLTQDFKSITNGSTNKIEQLIYGQIVVLNELFLALVSSYHQQENAQLQSEALDRAFRAADLCRKSSALLMEIKHPKRGATFVKQQLNQLNIQGDPLPDQTLLEPTPYAPLDTRSESKTSPIDQSLEAVDVLNRR